MKQYSYPHTINNGHGEELTFLRIVKDKDGIDKLEVENRVQPNSGPPMHTHFLQDEGLTVIEGKIGVQVFGGKKEIFGEGYSATFTRGTAHSFWNAGDDVLICEGWLKPPHNLEYFLTEIYRSTKENSKPMPQPFDAAFLMNRYKSEFEMIGIPAFVRNVIFPITLFFGKLTGKDKKFKDAPVAIK